MTLSFSVCAKERMCAHDLLNTENPHSTVQINGVMQGVSYPNQYLWHAQWSMLDTEKILTEL